MDHFMKKIKSSLGHPSEYTRDIAYMEREEKRMQARSYAYEEKRQRELQSACSTDSEDSDDSFSPEKLEAIDKAFKVRGCIRTRCGKTRADDYD